MILAGVDEAGRGPLAGPVIAAAVILQDSIIGATDSKKLSPKKRLLLSQAIQKGARCFAYGRAEAHEIDRLNIHHATLLAMQRAINALAIKPHKILIDGLFAPKVTIPCETIIKGDLLINVISCASILAKVARDHEMIAMDLLYPHYGFAQHKGYPTAKHYHALQQFGPSPIHRYSYKLQTSH